MAVWLLIALGLAVLVVVAALGALVWVVSGRASSERANIQHNFGPNGPSI
ncbi:hypothetical protein FB381_2238 [Nocardioides albertanoniae]|uniref:Uncharacterized protein n=1 Tax=Nocardioides albertanoniae TaxID=1175486 RepID=A0A543A762_9ACTN|nr:hypothetical protein FB381_2238 [Nocardioides albertanoniae]